MILATITLWYILYFNKRPALSVHTVLNAVEGNGTNLIEYASTENRLRIYLEGATDLTDYEQGRTITLAGDNNFEEILMVVAL